MCRSSGRDKARSRCPAFSLGYRNHRERPWPPLTPIRELPKAFISYSWDDEAHKDWVKQLATRLRADGVEVTLDHWHSAPGDQIPLFMERAVRDNSFVIAICTPRFKERSDEREGGVGYEGDIMTAYALTLGDQKKFIPVLRRGSWNEAAPTWLLGRAYRDLSNEPYSESQYQELLKTLLGTREKAPRVGAPQSNVPARPEAGFFGRKRELWDIERWFVGKARRITLTGFGGQGKTALALEAARWLTRTKMFEAAVFVDYSRVQAADALSVAVSNIGSVLGQSLIDASAAREALKQTPTLVVLDNLEAVAAEPLRELLDAAKGWSEAGPSRVLLTTRTPDFGHPDYRVEGTLVHRRIVLEGLGNKEAPDDALEWFAELSKLPPAPTVPTPTREELIELFDKVRFHPLSIRTLAAQLKTRHPAELGERLEQLLAGSASGSPAAASTEATLPELVASLKLSLDRLDAAARQVLPRLGVFQGGAFEPDLLAITGLEDAEGGGANVWPDLRRQLEAAALIEAETVPGVKPPFLRFHPTLAPMLWEQLGPDERARLTTAHRQRYYGLASYPLRRRQQEPARGTRHCVAGTAQPAPRR